ncbi:hypothetical protein BJX64DRAFT_273094, partial [Aspergillus heterothallicus]
MSVQRPLSALHHTASSAALFVRVIRPFSKTPPDDRNIAISISVPVYRSFFLWIFLLRLRLACRLFAPRLFTLFRMVCRAPRTSAAVSTEAWIVFRIHVGEWGTLVVLY